MPYRFEADTDVEQAFRRVAGEQLDSAIQALTVGADDDPVQAVHSARKALKKERSLLRLASGSLDGPARRRHNARLRDAGRGLSGQRDADVMIQALGDLGQHYSGQVPKRLLTTIARQLKAHRGETQAAVLAGVAEQLRVVRPQAGDWQLRRRGWAALEAGLRRSYRRGATAFRRAAREPTVASLHEWRKRAKDLWYHLRLLEAISPAAVKGLAKEAHALSDRLGDDHDLALLRDWLVVHADDIAADVEPVLALIDHRRAQLQQEARFLGECLYAEKPGRFLRRTKRYWKAWRGQARATQARRPAELASAAH